MLWPLAVKYVPFAVPFTARTMLFSSAEEQIRTGTPALVASEAAESFVVMPPVPLPDPAPPAAAVSSGVISFTTSIWRAFGSLFGLAV